MKQKTIRIAFSIFLLVAQWQIHAKTGSFTQIACPDSLIAQQWIQKAQILLDSSAHDKAYAAALKAQSLLLNCYDSLDVHLIETYCIIAQSRVLKEKGVTEVYRQRLLQMRAKANPLQQAHIENIQALSYLALDGDLVLAAKTYRAAIDQYQALAPAGGLPHQNIVRCCSNLGLSYKYMGEYPAAFESFNLSEQLGQQLFPAGHPILAHAPHNRGLAYWERGLFEQAFKDLYHAFEIREKALPSHRESGASLNNLGLVYSDKGALEEAQSCFEEGLVIAKAGNHLDLMASCQGNLGLIASRTGDFKTSLQLYKATIATELAYNAPADNRASSLLNIGIAFKDLAFQRNDTTLLDSARIYLEQAKALLQYDTRLPGSIENAYGNIAEQKKQYKLAKTHYRKALELHRNNMGPRHPDAINQLFNLCKIALVEKDYPEALSFNDSALLLLGYISPQNMEQVAHTFHLAEVLTQRNRLFWDMHQTTTDRESLSQLCAYYEQIFKVFDEIELALAEKADRFVFKSLVYENIEIAILATMRLKTSPSDTAFDQMIFNLSEKSKAQMLLSAVHEAKAQNIAGVDPQLWQQKRYLQARIGAINSDISIITQYIALNGTPDSTIQKALDDSLSVRRLLKVRYQETNALIGRKYPDMAPKISNDVVQWLRDSLLTPNKTFVSYFAGEQKIFVIVVNQNGLHIHTENNDFNLRQCVENMTQKGIYNRNTKHVLHPDTASRNYRNAALLLYQRLVQPVEGLLKKELIVVPDGPLAYVPFEALLTQNPPENLKSRYAAYAYLCKKHQLSYGYSAAMLREMCQPHTNIIDRKTAFVLAPFPDTITRMLLPETGLERFSSQTKQLKGIASSSGEGNEIAARWGAKPYLGQHASIANFRQWAPQFQIIHISSHAKANERGGDLAWLAFRNGQYWEKLYARDFYNIALKADLVVLSACETGYGPIRRNEGVLCFSKAIAQAGARSIVTSLWAVKSGETKEIQTYFHQYLTEGIPKDAALQKARNTYFSKHLGEAAHPYYWAGFIAVGDMRPIRRK